jgi:hypothetical protein
MEKQKLIFEFNKNSVEIIKVHIGQGDKREPYIDVRTWYLPQPQAPGNEIATKKGIRLSGGELLSKLIEGLRQAQEEIDRIEEEAKTKAEAQA